MKDQFINLSLVNLPRINFAVITKFPHIDMHEINNCYNEFRFVESGSVTCKIDKKTYTINAGEYAFFPANCKYVVQSDSPTIIISIGFFLDEGYSSLIKKENIVFDRPNNVQFVKNENLFIPFSSKLNINERPYQILKEIMRDYDSLEEYNNINVASKLTFLFVNLAISNINHVKSSKKDEQDFTERYCQKVDDYIEQNYGNVVTMSIIARFIGLHENYISNIYKECRGMTVMTKLTMLRIEMAKKLLLKKKYTVQQVGEMVGYKDCKYFNTVFKKHEKISPGQYVKRFSENKVYSYYTFED